MAVMNSISLCARITLDLHNLNSEGTEGNQQQTRMVHIIDQSGHRAIVNAVSGDMFKHILVEHLVPLLKDTGEPLSPGAIIHDADRINALNPTFVDFCEKEQEFVDDGKTKVVECDAVLDYRVRADDRLRFAACDLSENFSFFCRSSRSA